MTDCVPLTSRLVLNLYYIEEELCRFQLKAEDSNLTAWEGYTFCTYDEADVEQAKEELEEVFAFYAIEGDLSGNFWDWKGQTPKP